MDEQARPPDVGPLVLAHAVGALAWGWLLVAAVSAVYEDAAVVWAVSDTVLWLVSVWAMARDPARAKRIARRWYALAVLGPFGFLWLIVPLGEPAQGADVDREQERRLERLEREVVALRAEVRELRGVRSEPRPEPAWEPEPEPTGIEPPPRRAEPTPEPVEPLLPPPAPQEPVRQLPPREPTAWDRRVQQLGEIDASELLGARALAIAGGVVMLLGIVFFFVLAVNRGWIGPEIRVACGAAASAIAFGAGLWIRRRFEASYSAVAAVGAGIAGGYATVLAAAALYDLLPDWGALIAAAAIAAVGVATSIAWSSEIVAGLGLIGAMLVPAAVALQGGLTIVGTYFVALVLVGAIVVAVARRWGRLLDAAALASGPQIAVLVATADHSERWSVLALAGVFWLLFLAAGIAWQDTEPTDALSKRSASLVTLTSMFSALAGMRLLEGGTEGVTLLVIAGVDAAAAVAVAFRERLRELAPVLGAAALAVAAVGVADLLSGGSLAAVWAAEGAVLAFLASRLRDVRLEVGALAYLAIATGQALAFEARPTKLLVDVGDLDVGRLLAEPAQGLPAVTLAAVGFAVAARLSLRELPEPEPAEGVLAFASPFLAGFHRERPRIAVGEAAAGGVLALYGAALGILGLSRLGGGSPVTAFEHAQVAAAAVWSAAAVALIAVGLRGRPALRVFGLAWLGVTLALVVAYDLPELGDHARATAALIVAAALMAAAVLEQRAGKEQLEPVAVAAVALSFALAIFGAAELVTRADQGIHAQGAALLAVAAVYGAVAVALWRPERDFASLLGAAALGLGAYAASELTSGTWLVLAWVAGSVALSVAAGATGEERLTIGAAALLGLALGHVIVIDAPLADLFSAREHPGSGIPALVLVIFGGVVLLRFVPPAFERERLAGAVAIAVLAVYACSLGILTVAQQLGGGEVSARFQRGHTGVSSLWGLIGVALLYAGLRRGSRALRLGGLALLGISLAKIFLYDLPSLSSVTRALSFLGVGALLLVAGLVYQRLTLEERPPVP